MLFDKEKLFLKLLGNMDADPEVEIVEPRSKTSLQTENSGEKVTTEDRTKDDSDQDLDDLLDGMLFVFGTTPPYFHYLQSYISVYKTVF